METKHKFIKVFGSYNRKNLANSFLATGDIYGSQGLKRIEVRRVKTRNQRDQENLSNDWITIGTDIKKSMDKFEKEYMING